MIRAKQAGAHPGIDERDLVARTKMQSPEPSEEDTMRMVSRASGGKSKAPFGTAVPQVQKLINTAIKKTMQEGTHISTGSFSSLGKWAELTKGQKITVTMGIWEMMREYALPAAPEPDTPIARGTVPENAPAQAQDVWIMSEEEFKQERDAEGGGLRIPKADVDKRKQHITKMATSSATRQQGRGAWNRAEKQAAQGAHPLETLSESDDAVSDQGHTSSVPESGTSMMGRGGAPKRGGPGRSVPVKTRTPTAVKNSFQHLDNSENETSGDEAMGAESESCQEEEVVMMSGEELMSPRRRTSKREITAARGMRKATEGGWK